MVKKQKSEMFESNKVKWYSCNYRRSYKGGLKVSEGIRK